MMQKRKISNRTNTSNGVKVLLCDDVERLGWLGEVVEVSIPVDRETRKPRGFAFVKFGSEDEAQKALSLDGQSVDGRNIKVSLSRSKQ